MPTESIAPLTVPELDFMIRVNRSDTKFFYPHWAKKNGVHLSPELEDMGPTEYNLKLDVEPWLHDDQKTSWVKGRRIYEHIKATGALVDQLGLADLVAIHGKGVEVFSHLFERGSVYGIKSALQFGDLIAVPGLHKFGPTVYGNYVMLLYWAWLDDQCNWSRFDTCLRFRHKSAL